MNDYVSTPISWMDETIDYFIPSRYKGNVKYLHPPEFSRKKQYEGTIEEALNHVLDNPLGYDKSFDEIIKEVYKPGKPIVFVVDDYTRPNIHTKIVLPILLARVLSLGIPKDDIKILMACGTHRMPKPEEYNKVLGRELYAEYKELVVVHNCDKDIVTIGKSAAGTPLGFNKLAFESSILIPITDTELHYFAGVAGTVKEICPGIAARETVRINHPKMFDRELGFVPGCRLGNTEGNPVITDIKNMVEIIKQQIVIFGVDCIVTEGEIVYVNAGDLLLLHEEGAKNIVPMRTVKVDRPGDLVIVGLQSWGINLYQTGKGIHAAWNATRKDGKGEIIIVSPCVDGVGNASFAKVMEETKDMNLQEALEYTLDNYCSETTFKIGNQKPVDLIRILKTVGEGNLKIVSKMDSEVLKSVYRLIPLEWKNDPVEAIRKEVERYMRENPEAQIYVLDDPGIYVVVE